MTSQAASCEPQDYGPAPRRARDYGVVDKQGLLDRYDEVRALTETLASRLGPEDQCVQSMPDASPVKWHLGHATWFFEAFVLASLNSSHEPFDRRYSYLFNSYYEALGPRHPRSRRGVISRPTAEETLTYRHHVDEAVRRFLRAADGRLCQTAAPLIELGLHHEQQHQELILTDIKHAFWSNPLLPCYAPPSPTPANRPAPLRWIDFPGGVFSIGRGGSGFAFDNERPRWEVMLAPYLLASRPVTCGEYLAFMDDGGYARPEFWLSDGWAAAQAEGWKAPLYWFEGEGGGWRVFTLHGPKTVDPGEPVAHISFYEAAAYAEWAGKRLPTEFEWEAAARSALRNGRVSGRFLDLERLHPLAAPEPRMGGDALSQMYGDVWEWTRSSYDPYPGYRPFPGAAAEYNGKFMVGQMVLRGGSCATPEGHVRPTYRNFFQPGARWQFSGVRLAQDWPADDWREDDLPEDDWLAEGA